MIRRLCPIAAIASAVLCIATVAVWIRSFNGIQQAIAYRQHRYSLAVDRGHLQLARCTCLETFTGEEGPVQEPAPYSEQWTFRFGARPLSANGECDLPTGGPTAAPSRPDQEDRHELAAGPVWLVAALTAAAPMALAMRWLMRSRSRPGFCRHCGYDLRASTIRCPECGRRTSNGDDPRSHRGIP